MFTVTRLRRRSGCAVAKPRGPVALLFLLPLATASAVLAGEPAPPGKAKPLCRADITPLEGLPSRGLLLVSFEEGVYRVRTDKEEFEVREADIRVITFHPLRKKQPERPRRGDTGPKRPARQGFLREIMRRRVEAKRKLEDLRRTGRLDAYISKRREQLASAGSVEGAMKHLFELAQAARVKGTQLGREEWGRLVKSIRDPAVRERMVEKQHQLMELLNRPYPGPRRPEGVDPARRRRRFGPGRGAR